MKGSQARSKVSGLQSKHTKADKGAAQTSATGPGQTVRHSTVNTNGGQNLYIIELDFCKRIPNSVASNANRWAFSPK